MVKYECLYKCRLCEKVFSNAETDSRRVALRDTRSTIFGANGFTSIRNTSAINAFYEMHYCPDGSFGVSDFIGTRKADEDGGDETNG